MQTSVTTITQQKMLKQMLMSKPEVTLASFKKAGVSSVKEVACFWEISKENPALAQTIVNVAVRKGLY